MQAGPKLSSDARRAATVETVIALAAEQVPTDITTAAIAQRMGLTQGALFRHFLNKDAILEAVMEWIADRLLARVEKSIQQAPSPLAALERVFLAHIDFVAQYPGVPRMLFGELQRPEATAAKRLVRTLLGHYGARVRLLLEDGKAKGELDAALDVEAAATLFIGSIQGLVMQSLIVGPEMDIRSRAPGAFAIYRRGIGSLR